MDVVPQQRPRTGGATAVPRAWLTLVPSWRHQQVVVVKITPFKATGALDFQQVLKINSGNLGSLIFENGTSWKTVWKTGQEKVWKGCSTSLGPTGGLIDAHCLIPEGNLICQILHSLDVNSPRPWFSSLR